MAGRQKFRIPTVNETPTEDVKTYSLFKSYQQNKSKSEMPSETPGTVKPALSEAPGMVKPALSEAPGTVKPAVPEAPGTVKPAAPVPTSLRQESAKLTTVLLPGQSSSLKSSVATSTTTAASSTLGHSSIASASTTTATATGSSGGKAASSNSIIVNYRQRGNPILKHIRNVAWEFGSIVPDYVLGVANCALFLSLRYHQLHSDYLHNRLKELGKGYDLRVLLVQVDVKDPHHQLKDLAKICILADLTLILAFSPEEAGRYLEAYKVYENKPAEALMEKTDTDYVSKLTECLTTVKSVNKTDSMTLLSAFKSMNGIIDASKEDISMCAGFGPQKAQRLSDVLHEPFLKCRKRPKNAATDSRNSSPVKKLT